MNIEQQRKILIHIDQLEKDIEALKQARFDAGISGYASATISSQGGSKSYTRLSLEQLTKLIEQLKDELQQYHNMLSTGRGNGGFKHTVTIYY